MSHGQIVLGLFLLILIVGMWKSGKLYNFWQATVG